MTLTVGSLFSGIGGLDLGLERAGMEVRWQSEIDPYASLVLAKHWPHVPNLGDITKIDWSEVERVDLICGGFPCQDISIAGKRAGLSGQHSGLWHYFADAIRSLRPRFALVENTTALTARGLDAVVADLADRGYDAEWDCIPAAAVGSHQLRARMFLLAYPARERNGNAVETVFAGRHSPVVSDWWATEPALGRVADGISRQVDRLRCLGNAVVPQVAQWIGEQLLSAIGAVA